MSGVIAQLYASIGADTTNLQRGLLDARGQLISFKSEMSQVLGSAQSLKMGLGNVNTTLGDMGNSAKAARLSFGDLAGIVGKAGVVLGGVATAGLAVYGVFKKIVDPTIAYHKEVRDLARNLGIATDETSRLIQVGDDWGISSGEISSALEMAVKNGYRPTIENLALLADRLQGIQNPEERAALLTQMFGRNWAALTPILYQGGDALRQQAAAVESGLVVTESASAKTREYEIAVDKLQDALTALKTSVGLTVVQVLLKIGMFTSEREQLPGVGSHEAAQQKLLQAEAQAARARRGYSAEAVEDAELRERIARAELATYYGRMKSEEDWGLAAISAGQAAEDEASQIASLTNALQANQGVLERSKNGMEAWSKIGQDAAGVLSHFKEGGDKWMATAKEIDEHTGSNIVATYEYEKALGDLDLQLRRGKITPEEYGTALDKLGESLGLKPFGMYEKSAKDAETNVASLQSAIDAIPDHSFKYIHVITTYSGTNFNAGMSTADYENLGLQGGRAAGGPAGPGLYSVGERGEEGMIVGSDGRVTIIPADKWAAMKMTGATPEKQFYQDSGPTTLPTPTFEPYPGWNPMDWTRSGAEAVGGGGTNGGGPIAPTPSTSGNDTVFNETLQQIISTLGDLPKAIAFTLRDVLQSQASSIRS